MADFPPRGGDLPTDSPRRMGALSQTCMAGVVRLPGKHSGVSVGGMLGAEGGIPSAVGIQGPFCPSDREDAAYDRGRWSEGIHGRVGTLRVTAEWRYRDRHLGVS